jgi:hypothetical protein
MTDPRFDPAFQRGYSGPDPELVAREREAAESGTRPETNREPEAPASAHNPYRLALLLFGIALLIAASASLYEQVLHPQASSTTVESQFVEILVSNLPPVLGLVGFICVILWLALGALDRVTFDTDRSGGGRDDGSDD